MEVKDLVPYRLSCGKLEPFLEAWNVATGTPPEKSCKSFAGHPLSPARDMISCFADS